MFKKTLIAVALVGLSANALAVDVQTSSAATKKFGSEALTTGLFANDGTVLTLAPVVLSSGAEYSAGDIVTVTITGGEFAAPGYTLVDTTPAGQSTVTFGLLSKTATKLIFRVTAIADGALKTTIGNKFTLKPAGGSSFVKLSSVAAGSKVVVTANAETSTGIALDTTAKDSHEVGAVLAQHSLSVNPVMAAVVDVTKDRKAFVDPAKATFAVNHTFTAVDQASMPGTANTIVVKGDFSAFKNKDGILGKLSDGAVDAVVAADGQSATLTYLAAAPADKTLTFTVPADDNPAAVVIPTSSYTVEMNITEATKSVALSAVDAGAFTLNGASVDVPYMPYGSGVEQFLWVTNKGNQAGDIKVTAFDQAGKAYGPFTLGSSTKGLKKLDAALKTELVKAGLNEATSPRVALNVTVNAPAADITVYAAYKAVAADDRLTVPTVSLNNDN